MPIKLTDKYANQNKQAKQENRHHTSYDIWVLAIESSLVTHVETLC